MAEITRRGWMAMLGMAPLAGGLLAWAEHRRKQSGTAHAAQARGPREHIRERHFPNLVLTTHEGRKVRFYDDLIKGKNVVINFMYAECERICIPVTANLAKVQRMMGDRVGRDVFFYSITLKAKQDTPEKLKEYAEAHRAGPGWLFLTGDPDDIETLRRSLGFVYVDPAEDAITDNHIGMVRIGNEPHMRWGTCPGQADPEWIKTLIELEMDSPNRSAYKPMAG